MRTPKKYLNLKLSGIFCVVFWLKDCFVFFIVKHKIVNYLLAKQSYFTECLTDVLIPLFTQHEQHTFSDSDTFRGFDVLKFPQD